MKLKDITKGAIFIWLGKRFRKDSDVIQGEVQCRAIYHSHNRYLDAETEVIELRS